MFTTFPPELFPRPSAPWPALPIASTPGIPLLIPRVLRDPCRPKAAVTPLRTACFENVMGDRGPGWRAGSLARWISPAEQAAGISPSVDGSARRLAVELVGGSRGLQASRGSRRASHVARGVSPPEHSPVTGRAPGVALHSATAMAAVVAASPWAPTDIGHSVSLPEHHARRRTSARAA